ncbi:nuclear pore complex protein Nup107 [Cryptococcus neoformans Bt1]|nr:nuclear pore complex protein Nup107 [Cryptococcus neoformans var. grubii Bt1]
MVAKRTPYSSFASLLAAYQEQYSHAGPSTQLDSPINHEAVLDEQGGLIASLMESLEETIRSKTPTNSSSFEMDGEEQISEDVYKALLSEHRAWQLIRAVYDNRIPRADPNFVPPSAAQQIIENPYTSPEDLIQTMVIEDPELSLWATLVEHLQTRPLLTSPPPLEARHGYLPSTVRRSKFRSTTGSPSLDPDFTIRDPHSSSLAGEDQTYQLPLLETLYNLVRYGELESAIKVCEQGGEPWRGASLMGVRRWTMGGMNKGTEPTVMTGNRYRALWKKSCRTIAKNHTLLPAERHLYAAMISDLPTLLPACESWEDHLWAHVQHRIEARLEKRWRELGGFWEGEAGVGKDDVEEVEMARGGLEEVFASMKSLQNSSISIAMTDPYHVAQQMILLDRTGALFHGFADQLLELESGMSPELIGPLLRFFTHLALILRTLSQPVPVSAANAIIQAYLQILEREGNDKLVAMYAACLREGSGEESYARFLWSMDPSASRDSRSEALLRAKKHNLDVTLIARETVRLCLEEVIAGPLTRIFAEPDIVPISIGLTEHDVVLIRSIEWLTILPETADDALVRSCQLVRYFLSKGQANAAQSLLLSLPSLPTSSSSTNQSHLLELASYSRLFSLFSSHTYFADTLFRQPSPTASKLEVHAWKQDLEAGVEDVWKATVGLVKERWLDLPRVSPEAEKESRVLYEYEGEEERQKQLKLIRLIFIPDLILRLHNALTEQSALFPYFLQRALELASIVADGRYRVYEGFLPLATIAGGAEVVGGGEKGVSRLEVYMDKIREVALEVLKSGNGNAFKVRKLT